MDKFQEALDQVSKWIKEYQKEVHNLPVLSQVRPNQILKSLPDAAPEQGESFEQIFKDFQTQIMPGVTHWQHPKFFGYFPANSSPPSILAEMLIATLGVQGMSWITSPAATELEMKVMEWLRELLGLPKTFTGVIQDSASTSTLIAMIVAREKATDFQSRREGLKNHPQLVAYCSEEAHSSIEKATILCGIGRENLRKIRTVKTTGEMDGEELEKQILLDRRNGLMPFFVVGAFGTTGVTAVDSLSKIGEVAQKQGLYFHVDAAYAGAALILPEMRGLARGIEKADSIVMNPHKWLLTTFDCSTFFVRDRQALLRSMSLLPEYLKTPDLEEEVINYRDWGIGLGRRFRSLKLWFVLKWYGVEEIQNLLRSHIELAKKLEQWIREDDRFEVVLPRLFNLVCFRLKGSDEANLHLMNRVNQSGKLFLTHTRFNGKILLRMVVGQTHVEEKHVREAWEVIQGECSVES